MKVRRAYLVFEVREEDLNGIFEGTENMTEEELAEHDTNMLNELLKAMVEDETVQIIWFASRESVVDAVDKFVEKKFG
ncbi:MAG: hypothetical protein J7L59_02855 [Nanoarchaeota archaeon]|nr:hypothetical protein [Nanoarchaeota archaeon]